jgi:hypothetical protein
MTFLKSLSESRSCSAQSEKIPEASLNQLVKKLAEFPFGCIKHSLSFFGSRILPPSAASLSFHFNGEIAFLLQAMVKFQQRYQKRRRNCAGRACLGQIQFVLF